jgi:hypothetical protein
VYQPAVGRLRRRAGAGAVQVTPASVLDDRTFIPNGAWCLADRRYPCDPHRFYELLRGPTSERLISESERGEAHIAVNSRNLASQIEFDFLDDVFSATA